MSIKKLWKGSRVWLLTGLLFLIAVPLSFNSCGSEYETPSTTQTPTALISPATLKAWMDAGLVNGTGYDRVVIIDLDTTGNYTTVGHIPGARWLDAARLSENRVEGPAVSSTEVATGARMDVLITELGITRNTTIVFTGGSYFYPARAYYTFRYWGFPKNRLKVLDGVNGTLAGTWRDLYAPVLPEPDFPTAALDPTPTAAATTYSVTDNGTLRNDLRVSLSEMIDYAEGRVPNALAIDVRNIPTAGSYAGIVGSSGTGSTFGTPPSPNLPWSADGTVFEGHINGAKAMLYSNVYNFVAGSPVVYGLFKDPSTIASYFTAASVGLDSTKTAYIYCKVGYMGAIAFFALDGILGWPAAFYDGSWTQWGQLSGNTTLYGRLDPNSPWRTDIASRTDSSSMKYSYADNDSSGAPDYAVELLTYDGSKCTGTVTTAGAESYYPPGCNLDPALYTVPVSSATSGNQIEGDDIDYMKSGSGGGGSGGGGAPAC